MRCLLRSVIEASGRAFVAPSPSLPLYCLGSRSEELASVEETALGAASTGQAHRATLRDGREVVLKLQYADARASARRGNG